MRFNALGGVSAKASLTGRLVFARTNTNRAYASKKHGSAEVVTICMLLDCSAMPAIHLCVKGSIPFHSPLGLG